MKNNKSESFHRLSQARLIKVKNALNALGNCSNKSAYEYTEPEVMEIFKEIEGEVRETKLKFKFEASVLIPGALEAKTWKQLAAPLKAHGSLKTGISREQWGQNCIKFFVRNSIFWFTCYSSNFKDPNKRMYGIFISFPGYFEDRDLMTYDQKEAVTALQSLVIKNQKRIKDALPNVETVESVSEEEGIAGWTRELSEFPSDEAAIKWLEEMLNTFTEVFVPLIQQVK